MWSRLSPAVLHFGSFLGRDHIKHRGNKMQLPDKRVIESEQYSYDFTSRLEVGETPTAANCVLQTGTVDISGITLAGNKTVFRLSGGQPGYVQLSVSITAPSGTYSTTVYIRILA